MRNNRKRYHPNRTVLEQIKLEAAQQRPEPGPTGPLTLDEILEKSPKWDGEQMAVYSTACCWWTSYPEDLGQTPPIRYDGTTGKVTISPDGHRLPCCPHCGAMLLQAPLDKFIEYARRDPGHYGPAGMAAFVQSHSRNAAFCSKDWGDYGRPETPVQPEA